MADPQDQAAFVAALRKKADELAASNPVFAEIRLIGKTLVDEVRRRVADNNVHTSIGAYLLGGSVLLIEPEVTGAQEAAAEILSKLKELAQEGKIQAAAMCDVGDRQIPGGDIEKFVGVHVEHSTGKVLSSAVPVDESVLMRGIPGASGPAVGVFGGPTKSKIFTSAKPSAPILKIAVMNDGRIMVDGSPATIDSVRVSLKLLAEQKGVVWYYREAAQDQGPPLSGEVIKAVIENRLSIRLSSRADYSDAIGADGRPITERSSDR